MCPVGYRLTAAVVLLSIIIADEPGEKLVLTSLRMHPYLTKKAKNNKRSMNFMKLLLSVCVRDERQQRSCARWTYVPPI